MMMHAIYVCDMYIDGWMLAINVCMRYVESLEEPATSSVILPEKSKEMVRKLPL